MAASSAAVAAPLLANMAGNGVEAKAAEAHSSTITYQIGDNCMLCPPQPCFAGCPVQAIYFDGEKYHINTDKCIRCGNCTNVCEIGAVTDLNAAPPVVKPHDVITRECDFLVVGAGTAGIIAATIAADLGKGKKIIVMEKGKRPGGSSFYANGVRFFSTKWQKDAGVPDQFDDYVRSAMNITRWELNPRLVENAFRSLPELFDWFCTWGEAEKYYELTEDRASKNRKQVTIKNWNQDKSRKVMHRLIDRAKELGVEFLTEHEATEFLMNGESAIAGVRAKDPGGVTVINCKHALISTGNVINSTPLMARCIPEYANALRRRAGHRLPTNTGDGVIMAERAGIPIDYNNVCVTYTGPNSSLALPHLRSLDQLGEAMYVNLHGKRWINESYVQLDVENGFCVSLLHQPRCMYFAVMDSKITTMDPMPLAEILTEGNGGGRDVGAGVPVLDENGNPISKNKNMPQGMPAPSATDRGIGTAGGAKPAVQPFEDFSRPTIEQLKQMAELPGRHVCVGNTLEELADNMGVDRKTFVDSVNRYNELCAKGRDDDYLKPKKYMLPIKQAPFFATSHYLASDGAVGGITINESGQIIGKSGPVENLYAAGDTTSSRFINRGNERIEIINDNSWAAASGFLAGKNVGKRLKAT
jgi:fumarate reductase flavoprotein subunit